MILEYRMRLKEIEERIEGDLKPLWGKLRTVDDIRFLLDLVRMQQTEIELLRRKVDAGWEANNKSEIYKQALSEIVNLLEKDSFEYWDKCVEIAKEALKYGPVMEMMD